MPEKEQAVPETAGDEDFDLEALVDQEAEGEGEVPAQDGDAAVEEDSSEEATQAEETDETGDNQPAGRKASRMDRIMKDYERLKKFEPIVEMIEEEPELGRQLAARRLGFRTEAEQPQPAVPAQPSAEETARIQEQWREAFEKDPIGALDRLIAFRVQQQTAGSKTASSKALVAQYKAKRISEEPLFRHYEPLFDALAEHANPDLLTQHPDQVLDGVESMAFGRWAKDQRGKASKARSKQPAPAREKPQSLNEGKQPAGSRSAKPPRKLTDEEAKLADLYGDEYFTDDETPEAGNPWR